MRESGKDCTVSNRGSIRPRRENIRAVCGKRARFLLQRLAVRPGRIGPEETAVSRSRSLPRRTRRRGRWNRRPAERLLLRLVRQRRLEDDERRPDLDPCQRRVLRRIRRRGRGRAVRSRGRLRRDRRRDRAWRRLAGQRHVEVGTREAPSRTKLGQTRRRRTHSKRVSVGILRVQLPPPPPTCKFSRS